MQFKIGVLPKTYDNVNDLVMDTLSHLRRCDPSRFGNQKRIALEVVSALDMSVMTLYMKHDGIGYVQCSMTEYGGSTYKGIDSADAWARGYAAGYDEGLDDAGK